MRFEGMEVRFLVVGGNFSDYYDEAAMRFTDIQSRQGYLMTSDDISRDLTRNVVVKWVIFLPHLISVSHLFTLSYNDHANYETSRLLSAPYFTIFQFCIAGSVVAVRDNVLVNSVARHSTITNAFDSQRIDVFLQTATTGDHSLMSDGEERNRLSD
jgi:hypothetical protein